MSKKQTLLKWLYSIFLLNLFAVNAQSKTLLKEMRPNIVFQYSSWGIARFELFELMERDVVVCTYTDQKNSSIQVELSNSEFKKLSALLQKLKNESYSVTLPSRGVVVSFDGEIVRVEINAISVQLIYQDSYEDSSRNLTIKKLVNWAKNRFPLISTPS